jgi:hypothetical protein
MSRLEGRLFKLEAAIPPAVTPFSSTTYRPGDAGFDAARSELGNKYDGVEICQISVIKGVQDFKGRCKDLTIVRPVVYPKPQPLPPTSSERSAAAVREQRRDRQ